MSTSQAAGTNVVPLLARIVLAAAFIPAGWNKLMSEATFEGEDAAALRSLGVGGSAVGSASPSGQPTTDSEGGTASETKTSALFGPGATGGWSMLAATPPAAPPASSPTAPPAAEPAKPATPQPGQAKPPVRPPSQAPPQPAAVPPAEAPAGTPPAQPAHQPADQPSAPSATTPPTTPPAALPNPAPATGPAVVGDTSPLKAASLHHVTLMVHRHSMAYPVYQAYLVTAVELVGGSLLLLGLFSRLWGIGLAGVMAVAFWFTSWPLLAAGNPVGALFSLPIPQFNQMFCQAGLFVLAFGVFLTGPGAVSLDRVIFRKAEPE